MSTKIVNYRPEYGSNKLRWPAARTSGIYGLADPRDMRVRYIGSSECIEHRLYAHTHQAGSKGLPRGAWLRQLASEGVNPVAVVLEEGHFGGPQSAARHDAEQRWIDAYDSVGEADLNVRLTPVGHGHSKDTPGKKSRAELLALRRRVAELELEISYLRKITCNTQRGATRCETVRDAEATHATQPFRGVAVLQIDGVDGGLNS